MINATPVRPLTSASPSGLPTPAASTPVPPAAVPPTPPAAAGGMKPVPKKKFSMKMIIGLIIFMIVAVGAAAGFYLTQMNQDTRQQASNGGCPSGTTPVQFGYTCQCPNGGPIIATSGTCPSQVNTCAGGGPGYACQSGTSCGAGTTAVLDKTCGKPGVEVCCKPQPAETHTCLDVPGNSCQFGSCTGDKEFVNGRTCSNGMTCCKPKVQAQCVLNSTTTAGGKCKCNTTGLVVDPGQSCPAPQKCGDYKARDNCNSATYNCTWYAENSACVTRTNNACTSILNRNQCEGDSACAWNTTTNSCAGKQVAQTCSQAGGTCVIGSCTSGGTQVSAVCGSSGQVCCKGSGTGGSINTCDAPGINRGFQCQTGTTCQTGYVPVVETGVTCAAPGSKVCCKPATPTCASQGGTCTIGSQCGAGQTSVSGTSGCGAGICCKPQPAGDFCKSQGGTCTVGTQCGAGQSAVPGTGGTCGAGICCKPTSSTGGGGGTVTGALCPNPPNLPAVKYLRFTCPNGCTKGSDGAFHCYENREDFTTNPGGLKNATDCGQVDVLSGTSDATYCGYTVNTCLESRCQKQPTTSPTPTATPIGNMCINITMAVNGAAATSTTKPKIGDRLTFTCAQVAGATRYRFRVIEPGNIKHNLTATGRVSSQYGITVAGTFKAECSACTGADNATCTDWPTRLN